MKPDYKKYLATAALMWAGCLVVFLFIYMLVLLPQQRSRKQVKKLLAEKKELCSQAEKMATEKVRNRRHQEIKSLRDDLKNFAVDFEDSVNLTFDISRLANEKGLGAFSIRDKERAISLETDKYDYIYDKGIDINFTGGFNQFAGFLNALERHKPVIFVDSFTIARSDREDSNHQVNMKLSVLVKKPQGG